MAAFGLEWERRGEALQGVSALGAGLSVEAGPTAWYFSLGERMLGTSQPTPTSPSPVVGCVAVLIHEWLTPALELTPFP